MSKRQRRLYTKSILDKIGESKTSYTFNKMAIANGMSVRIGSYCYKSKKK